MQNIKPKVSPNNIITYRSDIDGLRAIAVLLVVSFHAFPNWVRGGFIGVDIFFVISGFLISSIIFKNLDNGTFSFADFYARRIRRIFPALILLLITCFVLGWFALLADEFKQLGKHMAAGAGFVANLILWQEAGYFDNAADTKPLLHLWSLGIEEQFYMIWPIIVWATWKKRFNILSITIVLLVISYYLNLKGVHKDTVATFYAPHTRFWELLFGSVLAWFSLYTNWTHTLWYQRLDTKLAKIIYQPNHITQEGSIKNILAWIGVALLAYGLLKITSTTRFPGSWAMVPVLGAVLLISAGPTTWFNRHILSNKAMVWVGLISFPLYLWHWPLLSFARIVGGGTPTREIRLATVILAIILAWLTYRLIEKPIRFGKHRKVTLGLLILMMGAIGYVGYNTYSRDGLQFRSVVQSNSTIQLGLDGLDNGFSTNDCTENFGNLTLPNITIDCNADNRQKAIYALLGDSKAHSLYPALVRTSVENARYIFFKKSAPMLDQLNPPKQENITYIYERVSKNTDIKTVVIAVSIRRIFGLNDGIISVVNGAVNVNLSNYNYNYLDMLASTKKYDNALKNFSDIISIFLKAGKKVVLVVDNPVLPLPQDCLERTTSIAFLNFLTNHNSACELPIEKHRVKTSIYRKLLSDLLILHPENLYVFDTEEFMCNREKGVCSSIENGRPLYSYSDHISDYAAGRIATALNKYLKDLK